MHTPVPATAGDSVAAQQLPAANKCEERSSNLVVVDASAHPVRRPNSTRPAALFGCEACFVDANAAGDAGEGDVGVAVDTCLPYEWRCLSPRICYKIPGGAGVACVKVGVVHDDHSP